MGVYRAFMMNRQVLARTLATVSEPIRERATFTIRVSLEKGYFRLCSPANSIRMGQFSMEHPLEPTEILLERLFLVPLWLDILNL